MIDSTQLGGEAGQVDILVLPKATADLREGMLRGVVNSDAQLHSGALCGHTLAVLDRSQQTRSEAIAPPDHVEADRVFEAAPRLRQQVAS